MRTTQFDLNLLVSLHALLDERSVTRAAERVGVTQSAMSKALQRLRSSFGDELLVRVGRQYSLTPLGEDLADSLDGILDDLDQAIQSRPRFDPGTTRRTFKIAASDAVEYVVIRPLLLRMLENAPGSSIEVHTYEGPRSWELVENGQFDAFIASFDRYEGLLSGTYLFSDRRVCAVWSDHPTVGDVLTWEQLVTLPHASYSWPGYAVRRRDYPEWRLLDHVSLRFSDSHHLARLLMLPGTELFTFTFEKLAVSLSDMTDIKVVRPPFEPQTMRYGLFWHPKNETDSALCWLREQLVDIASTL